MMSIRSVYYTDLFLAWAIRSSLLISTLAVFAFMAGGCKGIESPNLFSGRLVAKTDNSLSVGPEDRTRNQPPQGGIDEKSGTTPTKPVE